MSYVAYLETRKSQDLRPGDKFAYDPDCIAEVAFVQANPKPKDPREWWRPIVFMTLNHPSLGRIAHELPYDREVHLVSETAYETGRTHPISRVLERQARQDLQPSVPVQPKKTGVRIPRAKSFTTQGVPATKIRIR